MFAAVTEACGHGAQVHDTLQAAADSAYLRLRTCKNRRLSDVGRMEVLAHAANPSLR